MDFHAHFNDAQRLADSIDDWENDAFGWQKAYVAAVFAAVAYEEVPQFELKKSKRAKLIPCDRFQAHVSRWETEQRRATLKGLDTNTQIEVIVRGRVIITISRLRKVATPFRINTTPAILYQRIDGPKHEQPSHCQREAGQ